MVKSETSASIIDGSVMFHVFMASLLIFLSASVAPAPGRFSTLPGWSNQKIAGQSVWFQNGLYGWVGATWWELPRGFGCDFFALPKKSMVDVQHRDFLRCVWIRLGFKKVDVPLETIPIWAYLGRFISGHGDPAKQKFHILPSFTELHRRRAFLQRSEGLGRCQGGGVVGYWPWSHKRSKMVTYITLGYQFWYHRVLDFFAIIMYYQHHV